MRASSAALALLARRRELDMPPIDAATPETDGAATLAAVRALKARGGRARAPAIAGAAHAMALHGAVLLAAGFDAHPPKPVRAGALAEGLRVA